MTPLTLAEAADAQPSSHITRKLLYREYRAGRLNGGKLGGTICTTEGDMQDWIDLCLGKNSRPASTSAKAARPAGSSETGQGRSAQATALSVAEMLGNCKPRSEHTLSDEAYLLRRLLDRQRLR